jgi:inner membrane protein
MFNTTHTLVGLTVAKFVPTKWVRYSTATAVIAANLPDIDSIAGFWGTAVYLDHHRGLTHSLIGVPLLSLLLAAVMYFFSANFGRTYVVAVIAMLTHPALDFLNSYGVRPFLPLNSTWFYGDLVFIMDPYLDLIFLLGLVAGWIWPRRKYAATVATVALATAYIGLRVERHDVAVSRVQPLIASIPEGVEKWAVLPNMWNPQLWDVVLQSGSRLFRFDIDTRGPVRFGLPRVRMESALPSEIVNRAMSAPSSAALLRFARFPVTRVGQSPSGHRVTFLDFRFYREAAGTALASEVLLDQSLQVVGESISFVANVRDEPID